MSDVPPRGDLLSGAALVLRNAREWLSEANLVHTHQGNNGHVVALACLALEEGAKAFLWLLALTEPEPRARKQILGRAAREHGFRMDVALGLAAAAWMTRHQPPNPSGACLQVAPRVFPHHSHKPPPTWQTMSAEGVQRFLDSALKKAGLPDVRFHDLRHTAGTLLMRHDGRVGAAQHRLGHARPSTTLNLYGRALPGDQRQATEHMLEAIERERRRNASPRER